MNNFKMGFNFAIGWTAAVVLIQAGVECAKKLCDHLATTNSSFRDFYEKINSQNDTKCKIGFDVY